MGIKDIPETPLVPKSTITNKGLFFGFPSAENPILGFRHKIGGFPDWIKEEEIPTCSDCGQQMIFYGQLDSLGEEVNLGDCGMIYVFICEKCLKTFSILQTY